MADALTEEEALALMGMGGSSSANALPPPTASPSYVGEAVGGFGQGADPRGMMALPELLFGNAKEAVSPIAQAMPFGVVTAPIAKTIADIMGGIAKLPRKEQAHAIGSMAPIIGPVLGPGAEAVIDRIQNPTKDTGQILSRAGGQMAGEATLNGFLGFLGGKGIDLAASPINAAKRVAQPGWQSLVDVLDFRNEIPGKTFRAVEKNTSKLRKGGVMREMLDERRDEPINAIANDEMTRLGASGLVGKNQSDTGIADLVNATDFFYGDRAKSNPKIKEMKDVLTSSPDLKTARTSLGGIAAEAMDQRRAVLKELDRAHSNLQDIPGPDGAPLLESLIDPTDIAEAVGNLKAKISKLNGYPHEERVAALLSQIEGLENLVQKTSNTALPNNSFAKGRWPKGVTTETQYVPTTLEQLNDKIVTINSIRADLQEFNTQQKYAPKAGRDPSRGVNFDPEIMALRDAQTELRSLLDKKVQEVSTTAESYGVDIPAEVPHPETGQPIQIRDEAGKLVDIHDLNNTYAAAHETGKLVTAESGEVGVNAHPKGPASFVQSNAPQVSTNPMAPGQTRWYDILNKLFPGSGGPSSKNSANSRQIGDMLTQSPGILGSLDNLAENPAVFSPPGSVPIPTLGESFAGGMSMAPPLRGAGMGAQQSMMPSPALVAPPMPPPPPALIPRSIPGGGRFNPDSMLPVLAKLPLDEQQAVYGAIYQASKSGDPLEMSRTVGGFLTAYPEAASAFEPSQTGLVSEYNGIIADPVEKDKYKGRIERALWAGHINANQYGDIVSRLNVDSPLGELPESLRAAGPKKADPYALLEGLMAGQSDPIPTGPMQSPVGWQPQTPIQDYSPISESAFSPLLKVP